jgi:TolB-like protein/ketosteroid isomerase-like protein
VRQLSEEKQHPYQAILGEDLPLAAHPAQFARVTPPPLLSPVAATTPRARPERVAIRNFENLRPDPNYDWMQRVLGQDVTTAFSAVRQLEVYDEDMVRFLARGTNDAIDAAQRAGMDKLVEGTYWVQNDRVSISAHVKGIRPLQRVASAKLEGPLDQFSALSGRLVISLLEQLRMELPPEEAKRILTPGTTDLAARKLLFDAERPGGERAPERSTPRQGSDPEASLGWRLLGWLDLAGISYAASYDQPELELRTTIEGYRVAFENEDIETLGRYYVEFTDPQRASLSRYFDNADDLRVEFSDVRIALIGDEAAVSFTRRDRFIDRQTGEAQQVVARVTKLFAKGPTGWQIVPEH